MDWGVFSTYRVAEMEGGSGAVEEKGRERHKRIKDGTRDGFMGWAQGTRKGNQGELDARVKASSSRH